MQFTVKHQDIAPVAVEKIKHTLKTHSTELRTHAQQVEERWEGNTLHFGATLQGQRITGTLEVQDHLFNISVKLPLMLRIFEGKIERAIREQAGHLLQ